MSSFAVKPSFQWLKLTATSIFQDKESREEKTSHKETVWDKKATLKRKERGRNTKVWKFNRKIKTLLSRKNILNGLGRAVYGGKPHDVPKALQSVNMKNTSEKKKEGGARGLGGAWKCRHEADTTHFAISVHDMTACTNDVGQFHFAGARCCVLTWSENNAVKKNTSVYKT